jgi:hypothetical protein
MANPRGRANPNTRDGFWPLLVGRDVHGDDASKRGEENQPGLLARTVSAAVGARAQTGLLLRRRAIRSIRALWLPRLGSFTVAPRYALTRSCCLLEIVGGRCETSPPSGHVAPVEAPGRTTSSRTARVPSRRRAVHLRKLDKEMATRLWDLVADRRNARPERPDQDRLQQP